MMILWLRLSDLSFCVVCMVLSVVWVAFLLTRQGRGFGALRFMQLGVMKI